MAYKNHILLCPGPVIIAQNVFAAMTNNIGHREEEFSELLERINNKFLDVFEIKNKELFHPILITGSGTAANEAVLSSIVGNKHILILSNGEFGERLQNISKLHNKNTHKISFKWGEEMDLSKIEKYLQKKQVDIIAMVHHETSVGRLNPVNKIGVLAKKYNKIFYIDCVSSVGADKIDLEKWNVSFCTTSSGKALCSAPGIGIIIVRKKTLELLKEIKARTAYLNLFNIYKYSVEYKQTPNTPAVHLFYALEQALSNILDIGVEAWREEIKMKAQYLRIEMKKMGLSFLIPEADMSSSLTTVHVPKELTFQALRTKLKEREIVIYNGKGPFLDKVFQVGNIGLVKMSHIKLFLNSLKEVIQEETTGEINNVRSIRRRIGNVLPKGYTTSTLWLNNKFLHRE